VHGRPLTFDLAGVLHCRACRADARLVSTQDARALAAEWARAPIDDDGPPVRRRAEGIRG
jgi:hypothetical protein